VATVVDTLTVDCADPRRLAAFWCTVLSYELADVDDKDALIRDPLARGLPLLFQVVPEGKRTKNRLHLDLSPPDTMQAEVDRLTAAGATVQGRVDEGEGFWTVLLDPEGNEFCVLRGPHDDPPRARP
jgi:predicted enzyme related to lactoylglutathione lyase